MADRPIIFSPAMVRALLAGTKTQTRRLATSPLRRIQAGDRLYVREHWRGRARMDTYAPRQFTKDPSRIAYLADGKPLDCSLGEWKWGKHRQGMHMPRWASRLTLIIEGVKVEPLQAISEADAIAEGVERNGREFGAGARPTSFDDGPNLYTVNVDGWHMNAPTAAKVYHMLWDCLHGAGAASQNPDVLALTFRVERGNIDRLDGVQHDGVPARGACQGE